MDLSFAFHLFSLVAFVALAWKLVRVRADMDWARSLWSLSTRSERVYADWPEAFLRRWCRLIQIPYEGRRRQPEGKPSRLRPKAVLRFFAEHQIRAVRQEDSGFLFVLASPCDPQWESMLRQALGERCTIRFHVQT